MNEDFIAERLAALRAQKKVSAREMSLAIGQNSSYINRIENKVAQPSMQSFFYICEYLGVTPAEFFDGSNACPEEVREILELLKRLDRKQIEVVLSVVRALLGEA